METPITLSVPARLGLLQKIHKMKRISLLLQACCFSWLACLSPWLNAADGIEDAESSFSYISNTLQAFRESGRLVNNPGIDGSDLEFFIALLDESHLQFQQTV